MGDNMDDDEKDVEIAEGGLDDATMEGLTDLIGKMLETCLDHGMEVPLALVATDVNGHVLIIHHVRDEEDNELEAHPHLVKFTDNYDAQFQAPVNILVVDATGEAEHVLFDPDDIHRGKPLKTYVINSELMQ